MGEASMVGLACQKNKVTRLLVDPINLNSLLDEFDRRNDGDEVIEKV
jgi:hypothetical protein